jgi:hypothetical protein
MAGAVIGSQSSPDVSSQPSEWPSMTLTYEVEGRFSGLDMHSDTQIWKLEFESLEKWTKLLVSNTNDPRSIGDEYSLAGSVYTVYSSVTGSAMSEKVDSIVWPDWWLIPWREITLEDKGYSKASEEDGIYTRYTHIERIPCQPDPDSMLAGTVQPAACKSGGSYESVETVIYRSDFAPAIPIEVSTALEGVLVSHIRIIELVLHTQSGDVVVVE